VHRSRSGANLGDQKFNVTVPHKVEGDEIRSVLKVGQTIVLEADQ
jgi:hypothetical protein